MANTETKTMVTNEAPKFEYFQKYLNKYSYDIEVQRDIFQDACVKFYENDPNWDTGFPYGYFQKAIYWKAHDYMRKQYTRSKHIYDKFGDSELVVKVDYDSVPASKQIIDNFDDKLERDELLNMVLSDAPPEITMYLDGYSINEIAKKLKKTPLSVKLVRFRWIKKMKKKYEKYKIIW